MLSPEQQERFSRHLLLDGLGGLGQERLCAGAVEIALPAGLAWAAMSCARALAACGVARLWFSGGWASGARGDEALRECLRIAPDAQLALGPAPAGCIRVGLGPQCEVALRASVSPAAEPAPAGPAAQSQLGALAALEVLKLLAGSGSPAPRPLQVGA